eukprot:6187001-Pleurochrysis_carterae.AAC.1
MQVTFMTRTANFSAGAACSGAGLAPGRHHYARTIMRKATVTGSAQLSRLTKLATGCSSCWDGLGTFTNGWPVPRADWLHANEGPCKQHTGILFATKSAEMAMTAFDLGQGIFKCPKSVPARAATSQHSLALLRFFELQLVLGRARDI